MTRCPKAQLSAGRVVAAIVAAALALPGAASVARADTPLPASAAAVRNAIVAMALADAAVPFAIAASVTRDEAAGSVPASSAAMSPDTSAAMASMKVASARNPNAGSANMASYTRRVRPYRDPFLLILGVAY